jgi:hypothetical protein
LFFETASKRGTVVAGEDGAAHGAQLAREGFAAQRRYQGEPGTVTTAKAVLEVLAAPKFEEKVTKVAELQVWV